MKVDMKFNACKECVRTLSSSVCEICIKEEGCYPSNYMPAGISAKPPLGVMPERLWKAKRFDDLRRAISAYIDSDLPIKMEWVAEHNRLHEELAK